MLSSASRFRLIADRILLPAVATLIAVFGLLGTGSSVAYAADISCTPSNVSLFSNRVHIKCEESFGGIQYFVAPTSDAAYAARVLSILSTATVAARTVTIRYDPADTSGASLGCQVNDCRLIQAVGFYR